MLYKTLSMVILGFMFVTINLSASASESNDSIIRIANAHDITVKNGSGTISVNVGTTGNGNTYTYKVTTTPADTTASEWDLTLPFLEKKFDRVSLVVYPRVAFGWGWCFDRGYSNGFFKSKTLYSASIELMDVRWCPGMYTWFDFGFGINTDIYRFDNFILDKDIEGKLHFRNCPDSNTSEIYVFSWIFPLRFNQTIYRDFSVSLGVTPSLNTYAKAKSKVVSTEGEKTETCYKGLHQKVLTVDYTASLNFDFFSIYARYSPGDIFKNGYGPSGKRMWMGVSVRLK